MYNSGDLVRGGGLSWWWWWWPPPKHVGIEFDFI